MAVIKRLRQNRIFCFYILNLGDQAKCVEHINGTIELCLPQHAVFPAGHLPVCECCLG